MTLLARPAWRRARTLGALSLIYIALCFAQRLVYVGWIRFEGASFPQGMPGAFLKGLVFDAATCGWLFLPLAAFFAAAPARWQERRAGRALATGLSLLCLVVGLLSISFELFFWEEFHSRYNFIAVDYLVYTHEVVRNVWESYPVVWFFAGLFALLGILAWRLRLVLRRVMHGAPSRAERALIAGSFALLVAGNLSLNQDGWLQGDAVWAQELAKNSLFALFSAYNTNAIDYKRFYVSLDQAEADRITAAWLREQDPGPAGKRQAGEALPLAREIRGEGEEKRWNVMLVGIESMSARFLMHYGEETKNLTPNLDRMADEGLFLSKVYATGSRTVRGLEALNLALPPTPGQSILRRPGSDNLFTLGSVFRSRGYDTQFVYGGKALFDNMGPWFSSNGYEIVDKGEFAPGGVRFATAWGACDEDLFDESIRRADASFAKGKPFFQMIMTTSNHRPYDFPEGRIDIRSHTGRDGAIKYTDYAIGRFVRDAGKKPWFKHTLFVFVADHDASVAGGTELPIRDYLIPAIFYNPGLVKPRKIDVLASQMDIAPTILGLLGFSYRSWFFGQDLLHARGGRALLGTYQKVALLEPGRLTILEPNRRALVQELDAAGRPVRSRAFDGSSGYPEEVERAAAIYQSASELFTKGLSKGPPR